MTTDLERRLRDLADEAPPSLSATGLWERGKRRHRVRRAGAAAAAALALVGIVGGLQLALHDRDRSPGPAESPSGTGHLPRTIHVPSAWSDGTSDAGEIGPLAVIGSSDRKRSTGFASMVAYESLYGISAVDGTIRFLDLPTGASKDMPGEGINAALSPDGRWVAFSRYDWSGLDVGGAEKLVGWSVYDTVTGVITELEPTALPITDEGSGPVFSGDSTQVLVSYAEGTNSDGRQDGLVAFDVVTGDREVIEEPGHDAAPNLGSSPDGIVWSRGKETYTRSTLTGRTFTTTAPTDVVTASFRGVGVAYLAGTVDPGADIVSRRLYVGRSPSSAEPSADVPDAVAILGWRNENRVVVALTDRDYAVVDVDDGSIQSRGRFGGAVNLAAPMLAADLWAHDLVDGIRPADVSDQRPFRRVLLPAAAVALLLPVVWVVVRRRRG